MKPVTALTKLPEISTLLNRDDPFFERVKQMHDIIARRAYELFEKGGLGLGRELEHWFQAESELFQRIPLELSESDESFKMRAEIPGLSENDLVIKVDPQSLYITGKHVESSTKKKGKAAHSERSCKQVFREYHLPVEIDPERVTAELKGGVLEIEMPKMAKATNVAVTGKAA